MNYSVFIVDTKEGIDIDDFIGNTDLKTAATDALADAAESLVGMDFYDKYTDKLKSEKSVGLTGTTVIDVKVSASIVKRTNFNVALANVFNLTGTAEDIMAKDLKITIVVKGHLEAANILFGLRSSLAKKKDTSRIWKWAHTPIGGKPEEYFRNLIVVISSTDKRRFRGFVYENVFVENYEEYYDSNGEGKFTLTMARLIKQPEAGKSKDFKVKGPDFKNTALSIMNDVSSAAKTASSDAKAANKAAEKILGDDNDLTKKMKKIDKKIEGADKLLKGADTIIIAGNLSKENISKQISQQSDSVRKKILNEKAKDNVTDTKTKTKILDDGSTETTVTKTNPDGSKIITVETKKKDGSISKKKTKVAKDD